MVTPLTYKTQGVDCIDATHLRKLKSQDGGCLTPQY